MIERIEHFAQTQPNFPVYNVLGEEHTYGDLKADSDSLAAVIDQLGLPEKSPVVVFGGQEYEMLATFVLDICSVLLRYLKQTLQISEKNGTDI